jgi:Fe-S oxidoreductase
VIIMDDDTLQKLTFCAMCQNPCRILFPAALQPRESRMPSAMAYLALAVHKKFLAFTPDVEARLSDVEGCAACKAACPHGVDTPALVAGILAEARRIKP